MLIKKVQINNFGKLKNKNVEFKSRYKCHIWEK